MNNQCNPIFISGCVLFLLLFLHAPSSITAQETEDEREFDYDERSTKGPPRWGELKKEWEACKSGEMQSPIDMSNQKVEIISKFGALTRNYKPCNATVKNRGHDISLKWVGDAGSIQINGTDYFLTQCHWHSPSEHSINGQRYALELHMVHESPDLNVKNKIAVVGLLYKIGEADVFLSKLSRNISSMMNSLEESNMGEINPADIKMGGRSYYKYMGSLTVPPCSEGVIWIINEEVATVSKKQVELLRDVVHDYAESNARPLQALNSREVHLYLPRLRPGVTKN